MPLRGIQVQVPAKPAGPDKKTSSASADAILIEYDGQSGRVGALGLASSFTSRPPDKPVVAAGGDHDPFPGFFETGPGAHAAVRSSSLNRSTSRTRKCLRPARRRSPARQTRRRVGAPPFQSRRSAGMPQEMAPPSNAGPADRRREDFMPVADDQFLLVPMSMMRQAFLAARSPPAGTRRRRPDVAADDRQAIDPPAM